MKKITVLLFLAFSIYGFSQEMQQYNYAEIIVLQKVGKKKSDFKEVYLNSSTTNKLSKDEIAKVKNNASLLKLMNSKNWEYVNRIGSQPSNSGPIWINYVFRKKQ